MVDPIGIIDMRLCFVSHAIAAVLGMIVLGAAARLVRADEVQPAPPTPNAVTATGHRSDWASSISLGVQVEGGISLNPVGAKTNFGQLLTDHANQATLNQILLTAQRLIDPRQTGWDMGFKLQLMYGSDARYTHFLGELDRTIHDRYQLDVVEANASFHAPVLTEGGFDLKLGQFPSPLGSETIDPSTSPFYSHSYIFNFGLPFKSTGGYATIHVTPVIDIWVGGDSGVNTSLGGGDNNSAGAVLVGFGLNLLAGNLTVLALSHVGPESPSNVVPHADHYMRYLNDIVVTWKATNKLTLTTEANYIRDDLAHADGGGIAQYVSYALSDKISLNGRAEVWRDDKNFYVASFPGNLDYVDTELGRPATVLSAPRPTTYSEFTVGLTYKPTLPPPITGLMLRPEVRYDRALNGSRPFNAGRDNGAVVIAADAVLGF